MSANVVTPPPRSATAYLVPISGPTLEPIELKHKDGGVTLGRHEQCDVCLPADAEKVSRHHARFDYRDGRWSVVDLKSRWGTYINGCRVHPDSQVPLNDGDLVRITPWTFTLSPQPRKRALQAQNDAGQTMVRAVTAEMARPLAEDMLTLLLESAASIHSAENEQQLADTVMDAARRGTGLTNAVMLRPVDTAGHVEIISSKLSNAAQTSGMIFSRSLIAGASNGAVAEISSLGGPAGDVSQSIVQMRIASAICVPLMLGGSPAAYLYLDSRGTVAQSLRANASAFCVALGRMASLALANLKRIDMERRESVIRAELTAAAVAQRWIMPKRVGKCGVLSTIGESKPGQFVGGDFFDLIELNDGRMAVALGDVSGKGISASVLMTATQGFLHASLKQFGRPGEAVTQLNQFVSPRRPDNKFVTMWVGVFDPCAGTLSYVDCGHSYALRQRGDVIEQLNEGGGLPIGIDDAGEYIEVTVDLKKGDRVIVVSDGFVEQMGLVQMPDGSVQREQFELDGVRRSLAASGTDPVADVFAAIIAHAGTDQLSDDATSLLVTFET